LNAGIENAALLVKDKVAADDAHVALAIHLFLAPYAIPLGDHVIRVGEQDKGQSVLLAESLQYFLRIGAHTNHHGIRGSDSGGFITESLGVDSSAP
jgi:hypothetical protein